MRIQPYLLLGITLIFLGFAPLRAQESSTSIIRECPGTGIQSRPVGFQPGGVILTTFDRNQMWVLDLDRGMRYPLPDTSPCGPNCRLSPDAQWVTYLNPDTNLYSKMRVNGTQRSMLVEYASDVEWWDDSVLLVWTPGHTAYLMQEGSTDREYLSVEGVTSIQPGGRWGVQLVQREDQLLRNLVNLETRDLSSIPEERIPLGESLPYYSTGGWSPDGASYAYVAQGALDPTVNTRGAELYGVRPGGQPEQWTDLNAAYGAVRINGRSNGDLSWSPDGQKIAFWVIELLGTDPEGSTGSATIHVLDVASGDVRMYCDFSTNDHTPYTPRLIWSPDSTHVAFGANIAEDEKGYLLLALDIQTGVYTELSDGIYPALGNADPIAWGVPPR